MAATADAHNVGATVLLKVVDGEDNGNNDSNDNASKDNDCSSGGSSGVDGVLGYRSG